MREEDAITQLREGEDMARRQAADLLGAIGRAQAVEPLVQALQDEDWGVRTIAERSLWQIWCRSGDSAVDALLQEGIHALDQSAWAEAVAQFTTVIERAPEFAEGYNKRATTYYVMGEYAQAIADCEATVARNPYHFGALSGAAQCYLALGRLEKARDLFRRALAVNPNMPGVEQNLAGVERSLRGGGNGSHS
ncbi:MAG: tetratricopeptide repeat protein [candidate division NC10 bacterium]|nr:tetratricopeptide repeat protein [candidate division NC10 bacterium]